MSDPSEPSIKILPNGPLLVSGVKLVRAPRPDEASDAAATATDTAVEHGDRYALCRCGASANKPFCDGAHHKIDFSDA